MKPLLEIQTVPISIEFRTNPAQRKRTHATAELEISRQKNGLRIQSRPLQLNIDTFEARNSVVPTTKTAAAQNAQLGKAAAYEATARFSQEGNMLLDIRLNQDAIGQIIDSRVQSNYDSDFNIGFIPSAPAELDWTAGDLQIQYEMDKLNFDWKTNKGEFEFIPANIEFTITQQPKVIIKYVGGPIYVPPSADPSYVPLDTKA